MGSKPKPYKPSAEEIALQKAQLEEMKEKDSEINEAKHRRHAGGRSRSLVSQLPKDPDKQLTTLGV